MSCQAGEIADAVTAELDGTTFSSGFTPTRKWRANYQVTALKAPKVVVLPGPASFEVLDRRRDDTQYATDVVLLQKVNPDSNVAVDGLVALMEEIKDHFRVKSLTAGSTPIVCQSREFTSPGDALIDDAILRDGRTFVGVVRLRWRCKR